MKVKLAFGISFLMFSIIGTKLYGKLKENPNNLKSAKISPVQIYQDFRSKSTGESVLKIKLDEDSSHLVYIVLFVKDGEINKAKVDANTRKILKISKKTKENETKEDSEQENNKKDKPLFSGTIKVQDSQQAQFPDLAKIDMAQAVSIVKKTFPGKITEISLENVDNYLMYSVTIGDQKKAFDVKVDAGTGKVIGKETEKVDNENGESGNGEEHDGEED